MKSQDDKYRSPAEPERRWACLTLKDGLPGYGEQIAGARAWLSGQQGGGVTVTDNLEGHPRTTRWNDKLIHRNAMIEACGNRFGAGWVVSFRSPLCVGFSAVHAESVIRSIFDAGGAVHVQSTATLHDREDGDLSFILHRVSLEEQSARQRRYRKNQDGGRA